MEKLISLEDFNKSREQNFSIFSYPKPNGIECPKCKAEMMDSTGEMLCTHPPQRAIHCKNCDLIAFRIA